ncbi:hypothetical protein [Nostoc sp. TCL26-01]|uniref:hypothetical protein n=1 Tax=Nostoc sp. TCL26-01 TaxID=2576904 RepID=UPI0015BD88D1|nr:hypothetical protein [Nostoc sp. TCL26-01]QLE58801.1 hypothetical protein FD725_26845 [Nostoc sp. TCL26-01]
MNVNDFESDYREAIVQVLNELQSAVLLLEQAQRQIYTLGSSVQRITETVEAFVNEQKSE